ncbi:AP-2 complex subunit sigma-like isoform X3 [Hordeum vulgare subsp. vulgare]|uniref:AP-2 complex subunit sigma-like isoform X3 n=1 Tax=Hordeum vulgare subsp. vulgare TaxID=112509 RepID=UPI001D1A5172|nr:AP-2 complex subunit sigma-like isoform X3 [Hordeum vulgare subsp. vulgare]
MGIRFVLLVNKQGQTRLAQCYEHLSLDERRALEGEIIRKCLARTDQQCSFVEHRNYKVVYRRYASLFFLVGVDNDEASDRFCTCMLFSIFHEVLHQELGTCKPSWYTSWCASSVYIFMIAFMLLPHQNLIFSGQGTPMQVSITYLVVTVTKVSENEACTFTTLMLHIFS